MILELSLFLTVLLSLWWWALVRESWASDWDLCNLLSRVSRNDLLTVLCSLEHLCCLARPRLCSGSDLCSWMHMMQLSDESLLGSGPGEECKSSLECVFTDWTGLWWGLAGAGRLLLTLFFTASLLILSSDASLRVTSSAALSSCSRCSSFLLSLLLSSSWSPMSISSLSTDPAPKDWCL